MNFLQKFFMCYSQGVLMDAATGLLLEDLSWSAEFSVRNMIILQNIKANFIRSYMV